MKRKERLKNLTPEQALQRKNKIEKQTKIIFAIIIIAIIIITLQKGGVI